MNPQPLPLHLRIKVAKTSCYWFSDLGRRRVLAEERSVRRKAARLGLTVCKTRRYPGGWAVFQADTVIAGPHLTSAAADEFLTARAAA